MGTKTIRAAIAAICVAAALPSWANVSYRINGDTMTVTASSSYAGGSLKILWDVTDKGETVANWANSATFAENIPSSGGTYTVDLVALGITNGTPCRIAAFLNYRRLDFLKLERAAYVDTGIKDSDCYGVRFSAYGSSGSSDNFNYVLGSTEKGFAVSENNADYGSWCWFYRGSKKSNRPNVNTDTFNEVAFTNQMFTLNGTTVESGLPSGSVGNSGSTICIGKSNQYAIRYFFGYWSYVQFDGEQGNLILDYVPAQRPGDGKVGFFDRVSGRFVAPIAVASGGTQTGESLAGCEMASNTFTPNRMFAVSAKKGYLTITVPPDVSGEQLLILWDDADKGDDIAAWAHSAVITNQVEAGAEYTVRMASLGMRNGHVCRVAAANRYYPLDMVKVVGMNTYVTTEIPDSDVYGIRFGYYSVSKNANWGSCIGTGESTTCPGFVIGANGADRDTFYWAWQGVKLDPRPTVRYGEVFGDPPNASLINEVAFTNGVFTLDSTNVVYSGLAAGPVGVNGTNMTIGRSMDRTSVMHGWWSHVSFDDIDGNRILDFIPAKRVSDNKVGFYDRASKSFVVTSGTDNFDAGNILSETPVVSVESSHVFTAKTIPGFMIIVK